MAKQSTFGVGIIGTGWVAGAHIDTFKHVPGCNVVAICSRDKTRAVAKAKAHGVEAVAYDNLADFLKHPGLDIVSVCTPHHEHPEQTIAAAKAGKHIVIEKPVAIDAKSLDKMEAAVKKAGVQTSVCFEVRWCGVVKNMKAILQQKLLGNVFYGETSYFHGIGPWYPQHAWNIKKKVGADALLTAGCHALDLLIYLMDSPVVEVSGFSGKSPKNPLQYEYDPNSVAILKFANGAIGKVATSIECRQPYLFPILLQGDRGSIWNDQFSSLDYPGTPKDKWNKMPAALPDSGDVNDHPYPGQMNYFIDCLKSGKQPHNDLANTAHVHRVIFAINDAIANKRVVKVKK